MFVHVIVNLKKHSSLGYFWDEAKIAYRLIILKNSVKAILLENRSNQSLFLCFGKITTFKWNINHFSYDRLEDINALDQQGCI